MDEALIRRALAQAAIAEGLGEVPVGAVVWHPDLGCVAWAHNRRECDRDPVAHAEILALRQAAAALDRWRLIDCTLAVTLEPCLMCLGALVQSRIKRLVFGAWDQRAGAVGGGVDATHLPIHNHRFEIAGGVLEQTCSAQLSAFFAQRRCAQA